MAGHQNIGAKLRQLRESARLTQSDVARAAGVTRSMVSQVETAGADPSLSTLLAWVAACDGLVVIADAAGRDFYATVGSLDGPRGEIAARFAQLLLSVPDEELSLISALVGGLERRRQ